MIEHFPQPEQKAPRGPQSPGVVPHSLIPDKDFIPLFYVVHISTQRCSCCGTEQGNSLVYAHNSIPGRAGMKAVSHLVPVERFRYNVPIKVLRLAPTITPACHVCASGSLDLSHLPKPESTDEFKRHIAAFQEPPQAARPRPVKSSPLKNVKTIDDLL
jgi:hypothetical protein